jgi:hypothetical protein
MKEKKKKIMMKIIKNFNGIVNKINNKIKIIFFLFNNFNIVFNFNIIFINFFYI